MRYNGYIRDLVEYHPDTEIMLYNYDTRDILGVGKHYELPLIGDNMNIKSTKKIVAHQYPDNKPYIRLEIVITAEDVAPNLDSFF